MTADCEGERVVGQLLGTIILSRHSESSRRIVWIRCGLQTPKRSRELRQEMGTICDLLDSLDDVMTNKSQFAPSASIKESLSTFQSMLNEINERVAVSQTTGLKRLKWPFTKDENDRLLSRISRYKETFNLALNIQNM